MVKKTSAHPNTLGLTLDVQTVQTWPNVFRRALVFYYGKDLGALHVTASQYHATRVHQRYRSQGVQGALIYRHYGQSPDTFAQL